LEQILKGLTWEELHFSSDRKVKKVSFVARVFHLELQSLDAASVQDCFLQILPHIQNLDGFLVSVFGLQEAKAEEVLKKIKMAALRNKMKEIRRTIPEIVRALNMGSNTSYMIATGVIKALYPKLYEAPTVSRFVEGIDFELKRRKDQLFEVSLTRKVLYSRTTDRDKVGRPVAVIPFEWTTTCEKKKIVQGAIRPDSEPEIQPSATYDDKWAVRDALIQFARQPDLKSVGLEGEKMNTIKLKENIRYSLAIREIGTPPRDRKHHLSESSD
jgi:hypothetical protein